MRIEFTFTQEDAADLLTLANQDEKARSLKRKKAMATAFFIALAVVFFFVLRQGPQRPPTPPEPIDPQTKAGNLAVFFICLALAAGSLIWIFVIAPRRRMVQTLWNDAPDLQLPRTIELNEDGITQLTSASKTSWNWDAFRGVHETDRLIILRFAEAQSLVIPKSSMRADQIDALRSMLG